MKYLKRTEINTEKWNACVRQSKKPLIYAMSWYLDAAANAQWDALVFGDYQAVVPLPWNRKLLVKQVYVPLLIQQLGVFGRNLNSNEKRDVVTLFKRRFIRANYAFQSKLSEAKCIERINLILSLDKEYEQLKSNFTYRRKRYDKPKYQPFESKMLTVDEFMAFYKKNSGSYISTAADFEMVERVVGACEQNYAGFIIGAVQDGELVSAIFFSNFENRLTLLLSASSTKGYKNRANSFLIIEVIKKHQNSSKILDFEGSEIPTIKEFYMSFGAKVEPYYQFSISKQLVENVVDIAKSLKK